MAMRPCLDSLDTATRDKDGVIPLLDSQRLVFWHAQPHHFTLCVEGIEIYMSDYP
jgi:hypothetical protein